MRARMGGKKMFDSQKKEKLVMGIELARQHHNRPLYTGPLHLDVRFYFPYPQRRSKNPSFYHYGRPDLSNLIKLVEDVAQGVLYGDDCLIASICAVKLYAKEGRTEFSLLEIANETNTQNP